MIDMNCEADMLLKRTGSTTSPTDLSSLCGEWVNGNKKHLGAVKIVIAERSGELWAQAFGSCHPTPCDWKDVKALPFAASTSGGLAVGFVADYQFTFKFTVVVGRLDAGCIIVTEMHTFTDASGREPYMMYSYFRKV